MPKRTFEYYESWGVSELIEHIQELTYLLDEADELLEPREDSYANSWRERKDAYVNVP